MTGMSETDSCRLCAEEEESSEHLWLRCPAFIVERQRLGLGRTFDELCAPPMRIASAAENHLQAPAVTPTTTTTDATTHTVSLNQLTYHLIQAQQLQVSIA